MFSIAYYSDCRLRKFALIPCMLKLLEDGQEYKACQEVPRIPASLVLVSTSRQVSQLVVSHFDFLWLRVTTIFRMSRRL